MSVACDFLVMKVGIVPGVSQNATGKGILRLLSDGFDVLLLGCAKGSRHEPPFKIPRRT
ncbi:hypothetical protein DSECCO2_560250 [anaerobic digester metagenome]